MEYRRLGIAIFVAPLASVLVSKELHGWIVGASDFSDAHQALTEFWLLGMVATLIFLFLQLINRWSVVTCCLSGIVAAFLVDMIVFLEPIGRSSELALQANLLSKFAGGLTLGLCFWLIDPFRIVPVRKKRSQNRHYDVYGDF